MRRMLLLPALLLFTTACFDFAGERGELGFLTNAVVRSGTKWSPDHALAAGTRLTVDVGEHLEDGREPEDVRWKVSRTLVQTNTGAGVGIEGLERGWVQAEADGVKDWFRVRWREADHLTVTRVGSSDDLERVAVLEGVVSPLDVQVRDARGRPLGHLPADLELEGAELHEEVVHVRPGVDAVRIGFDGLYTTVRLESVTTEEVELVVTSTTLRGRCVWEATAWAGDTPVLWPGELSWSHTESTEPWVDCGSDTPDVRIAR